MARVADRCGLIRLLTSRPNCKTYKDIRHARTKERLNKYSLSLERRERNATVGIVHGMLCTAVLFLYRCSEVISQYVERCVSKILNR
jgi:hypothetical protein